MTDVAQVKVIKVGGSLLDWDQLPTRLSAYLEKASDAHRVLVVGGGDLVDVIRDADKRFQLGEQKSHWMCIDLLSTTAQILHTLVPSARWVESLQDLSALLRGKPGIWLVDTSSILRNEEPKLENALPHGWHVTTDSIAARFAQLLQGDLVLLKSTECPDNMSYQALSDAGYVDQHFPAIARELGTVEFVNLRGSSSVDQ